MATPFVSVIIPCRNEEKFIEKCLETILEQDHQGEMEVLVVDGMSTDRTRQIVKKFQVSSFKFQVPESQRRVKKKIYLLRLRLLDNPKKFTPYALNIGIREAKGDIIVRMDAHAGYEKDYISKCVRYLKEDEADNVGGIIKTLPTDNSLTAKAIALCLSSFFGAASSFRRGDALHRVKHKPFVTDTVFGGCYKRKVFDPPPAGIGLFNENLVRSQDIEFNIRLKKAGGKIIFHPEIVSYYHPKSNLKDFFLHNLKDGIWAILPLKFARIPLKLRHYLPLIFIAILIDSLILSFFFNFFIYLFFLVLAAYFLLSLFFSLKTALKEKDLKLFFVMPLAFGARHFGYGIGSLIGLIKLLI